MDLRYEVIKGRLSTLSKPEIHRILDNIDQICFDEYNYDSVNHKYCPLAMAMGLDRLPNPTDEKVKETISKRFNPVNVIKGLDGTFYTDNRKQDLINLCQHLLDSQKVRTFTDMNKNMLEIERKFLVKPHAIENHFSTIEITQGYIVKNEHGAVRIRIVKEGTNPEHAYLMSKVKVDAMSNYETVDEISVGNAEALLEKFATKLIKKTRYIKIVDGFKWEIDQFHQPNEGLLLAEIELNSPDQEVPLPDWIEREVTGETQYYNANM